MDDDLDPRPSYRTQPAFWWTFGLCVASTGALLVGALTAEGPELPGLQYLLLMPVVWIAALFAGFVVRLSGRRWAGNGILLGALAGAVIGFALCSGVGSLAGML